MNPTQWTYLKEMYRKSAATKSSGCFRISSGIQNVMHVFVYLKRTAPPNNDEAENNPYISDTFKLNAADNNSSLLKCHLDYGDDSFPKREYDSKKIMRIFNDLLSYAYRKNDYNTGVQVDPPKLNSIYSLIYFDLTNKPEKVTTDPKEMIFYYTLNTDAAADFNVHAIVLYEQTVKIDKVGNELLIA